MKKSLIKEIRDRKELFPISFSNIYPVENNINVRKNTRHRTIITSIHQSQIICVRIYKDGINLQTE